MIEFFSNVIKYYAAHLQQLIAISLLKDKISLKLVETWGQITDFREMQKSLGVFLESDKQPVWIVVCVNSENSDFMKLCLLPLLALICTLWYKQLVHELRLNKGYEQEIYWFRLVLFLTRDTNKKSTSLDWYYSWWGIWTWNLLV